MKIVADENLAFTDYFFAEFGEIQQAAGRNINAMHDVKDAEAFAGTLSDSGQCSLNSTRPRLEICR